MTTTTVDLGHPVQIVDMDMGAPATNVAMGVGIIAKPTIARVLTPDTLTDCTAKELAQLMSLQVTYTDEALKAMTPEHLALVERNSRPA